ncbi:Regulator of chromosome condensation 1/beta-lactamase-inhibitor protein II [Phytophthora cactorum]|nr:Regulator of chromosome condensation 1/beta-lactamase-inhibitor protein II [Phytophthora cactorum]
MRSEGDVVDGVCVRYACKCGHLTPVSSLFFSETCEKLVCRLPQCSVEEFESYYCGNLLVNLSSKEASMYQNRSSRCFSCPTCETTLSTAIHEQRYFFLCAHCRWDSLELGLVDDDPDALIMTAITRERQAAHEDVFQTLHSHYTTFSSSSANRGTAAALSSSSGASFGRSSSLQLLADSMKELQREHQMKKFRLQRMAEMGGWKYDQALAKVQEKEKWLLQQRREHQWPELTKQLAKRDMGEVSTAPTTTESVGSVPCADKLFPSRPLLRVKRTWRCVESIERGTAGILVKPQISPMSGDSSLPVSGLGSRKPTWPRNDAIRITFRSAPVTSEASEEVLENGQVVLQDLTPIIVGPYEDPNLADAFIDDEPPFGANGDEHNAMLLQATRNLIKIKLPNSHVFSFWSMELPTDLDGFHAVLKRRIRSQSDIESCRQDFSAENKVAAQRAIAAREEIRVHDSKNRILTIERDAKFVAVVSGKYHTLMLSESAAVFASGDNTYGALGVSDLADTSRSAPAKVGIGLTDVGGCVKVIAASGFASFALVVNNRMRRYTTYCVVKSLITDGLCFSSSAALVYSWGRGEHGVLGHGDTESSSVPRVLKIFNSVRVTGVSAGLHHVLVLTELDGVYAFGDGSNGKLGMDLLLGAWRKGRLGHNDELTRLKPTRVNFFRGRKVITVVAGGAHNLATSEMPQGVCVWSWGSGSYGQLGMLLENGADSSRTEVGAASKATVIRGTRLFLDPLMRFGTRIFGLLMPGNDTRWQYLKHDSFGYGDKGFTVTMTCPTQTRQALQFCTPSRARAGEDVHLFGAIEQLSVRNLDHLEEAQVSSKKCVFADEEQ